MSHCPSAKSWRHVSEIKVFIKNPITSIFTQHPSLCAHLWSKCPDCHGYCGLFRLQLHFSGWWVKFYGRSVIHIHLFIPSFIHRLLESSRVSPAGGGEMVINGRPMSLFPKFRPPVVWESKSRVPTGSHKGGVKCLPFGHQSRKSGKRQGGWKNR